MEARIHSYETMGSVDGPGLRYVVFFQGCNMKCLYCHNRDTWDLEGGTVTTLDRLTKKVESLKGFYKEDSGGVTVSGGEPLLQSQFIYKFFKNVHDMGLTTAVDTSGHFLLTESVKQVLDNTDYLLMDVKSLMDDVHKKISGVNREYVVSFFEYVKGLDIKIWLRYVFVPGYTDSKEDVVKLCDFIKEFKNIERVDILPYHDYGKEKWVALGYKYPLEDLPIPSKKAIEEFKSYIKEHTLVIVK